MGEIVSRRVKELNDVHDAVIQRRSCIIQATNNITNASAPMTISLTISYFVVPLQQCLFTAR